jgi:hypothetical protein
MLVIWKLHQYGPSFNLIDPAPHDKEKPVPWWLVPLNHYTSYAQESNAMKDVLKSTDVTSAKVTHHRLQAVQYAGSRGLIPWQIKTMTKHCSEKLEESYLPEVDMESLRVMSGFRKVSSLCTSFVFTKYFNYLNVPCIYYCFILW